MEQKQSEGRVQIKVACCVLVLDGQHNSCGSAGPRQSACVGCLDGISSNLRANEIIIYTSVRLTAGHRRLQRGGVTFLGCATVQADVVVIKRQAATTWLFLHTWTMLLLLPYCALARCSSRVTRCPQGNVSSRRRRTIKHRYRHRYRTSYPSPH